MDQMAYTMSLHKKYILVIHLSCLPWSNELTIGYLKHYYGAVVGNILLMHKTPNIMQGSTIVCMCTVSPGVHTLSKFVILQGVHTFLLVVPHLES